MKKTAYRSAEDALLAAGRSELLRMYRCDRCRLRLGGVACGRRRIRCGLLLVALRLRGFRLLRILLLRLLAAVLACALRLLRTFRALLTLVVTLLVALAVMAIAMFAVAIMIATTLRTVLSRLAGPRLAVVAGRLGRRRRSGRFGCGAGEPCGDAADQAATADRHQ